MKLARGKRSLSFAPTFPTGVQEQLMQCGQCSRMEAPRPVSVCGALGELQINYFSSRELSLQGLQGRWNPERS